MTLIFFSPLLAGKTLSNIPSAQQLNAPWRSGSKPLYPYPQSDQADLYYPSTVLQTNAWRSGTIPLWNPYNLGGIPLLANGQAGVAYPPRIVLALLVSPLVDHDAIVVLHVFLSGLFMFLFLKELRLRFFPSLLGAVGWMYAGFTSGLMQTEVTLIATTWLPAALFLIHRASRKESWRSAVGAGLALALMALGGQLQLTAIAFSICGIYAAALVVRPVDGAVGWRTSRRHLLYPLATFATAVGVAAVTLIPTAMNLSEGGRPAPTYTDFVRNHTLDTSWFSHIVSGAPPTGITLFFAGMFVGLVPLLFAAVGFLLRRPGAALGRWLALGSFLVAIGAPVVTLLAYELIPGVSRLSSTGQSLWVFDFGLLLLAAIGLDAVVGVGLRRVERMRERFVRPATAGLALFAALAVAVAAWQLLDHASSLNPPFTPRTSYASLFPVTPALRAIEREAAGRNAPRLIGFNGPLGDESAVFNLEDADGYDSAVSSRVRSLWYVVGGSDVATALTEQQRITELGLLRSGSSSSFVTHFQPSATQLSLLARVGVTTILVDPPELPALLSAASHVPTVHLRPFYLGGDADLFEVAGAQPRAWVVHSAEVVADPAAALRRFAYGGFDYRDSMVVEPDQGLGSPHTVANRGTSAGAVVRRTSLTPNGTSFSVRTTSPGWFVMTDMYAPGWRVTVNGQHARLLRANYTFRAVAVPAGQSRVVLTYRPPGFVLGAVTSIVSLVIVLTLGMWAFARRRRPRHRGRARRPSLRATCSTAEYPAAETGVSGTPAR